MAREIDPELSGFIDPPEFTWGTDKQAAVDHIVKWLKVGGCPLSIIRSKMTPFIPKTTLAGWRAKNQAWAEAIDDAFEIGCDMLARRQLLTAAGCDGYSTGNHKRDRLLANTQDRLLAKWDRRYRERLTHENDPENPMPSPTFVLQPVKSLQEIEAKPGMPSTPSREDEAEGT